MRSSRVGRRSVGGAVLASLVLILAGGASGYLLRPVGAPPALPEASPPTLAPVGTEKFADKRTVRVAFRTSRLPPLVVGMSGRVTANACKAGRPLESGEIAARINGTPIIALATSVPLYRNLRLKDATDDTTTQQPADDTTTRLRGADVAGLQRELNRLGYTVQVDGVFGEQTKMAVQELQESLGISPHRGVVHHKRILWLPDRSVVPDSCELVRGEYVTAHQPYAKIPNQLTAIVAKSIPQDAVEGARTITVLGVTGPMSKRGVAKDSELLQQVTATRAYQRAQSSGQLSGVTATIALRKPLDAMKVPAGALFAVEGKHACVQSGSKTIPVEIVGSQLGVSLVLPMGEAPEEVNLGPTITQQSCGNGDR